MATSAEASERVTAARFLAETGESRFAQVLRSLAADPEEDVRIAVARGIDHVIEYGDQSNRSLDDDLVLALYDFLLACSLRKDRGPGNGFAEVLFRVAPARATKDFQPEHVLTFDRNWLRNLVQTLRAQRIAIPLPQVRSLLDQAKSSLDRPDFKLADDCSSGPLTEELLTLLAETNPEEVRVRMTLLQTHSNKEARSAAQRTRERLTKIDPFYTAYVEMEKTGSFAEMRPEYRVVYLVHQLYSEVGNGGWLQWVANSEGEKIRDTADALRAVNAPAALAELQKVLDVLGPGAVSPSQDERMAAIDRMMNAGRSLPRTVSSGGWRTS
jgi:hypothetical protein